MSYNIELLKYKDVQQSLDLINSVFKISMSVEVWKWYIFNNPDGASRVYLLYNDEKLIGLHGWSPSDIVINEKKYKASYGHSLAILKEERNTASYIKLMKTSFQEEINNNIDILIGHPNETAYISHKSIMKMKDFCSLDIYKKEIFSKKNHNCHKIINFDKNFYSYYKKSLARYNFYFSQTLARLNWRFLNHPNSPYEIYITYQGKNICGHIILNKRLDEDNNLVVHIMDINALNNEAFEDLIKVAENYSTGSKQIDIWCVDQFPFRIALEHLGFIKNGVRPIVIKTGNNINLDFPSGNATYMYGDADKIY